MRLGHILLGLQILVGFVLAMIGGQLFNHAYRKGVTIQPLASLYWFYGGLFAFSGGILLMLSVPFMYLGPLP